MSFNRDHLNYGSLKQPRHAPVLNFDKQVEQATGCRVVDIDGYVRELRMKMKIRKGFAVKIMRSDKTGFLACSNLGDLPVVFLERRRAVGHKRVLQAQFKCKVVPVRFAEVEEIKP